LVQDLIKRLRNTAEKILKIILFPATPKLFIPLHCYGPCSSYITYYDKIFTSFVYLINVVQQPRDREIIWVPFFQEDDIIKKHPWMIHHSWIQRKYATYKFINTKQTIQHTNTNKQLNKQNQTHKQTQTNNQTIKHTNKQTHKQKQTNKQTKV